MDSTGSTILKNSKKINSNSTSQLNDELTATKQSPTKQQIINTMNTNTSASTLSLLTSQMMSSSSSLLETDSKKLVMSKSKKLGQILKLASVRGVKSKSLKHKFTSQLQQQTFQQQQQQQKHSFISFEIDSNCHVCQKSLHEKKALHCKSKSNFSFSIIYKL